MLEIGTHRAPQLLLTCDHVVSEDWPAGQERHSTQRIDNISQSSIHL